MFSPKRGMKLNILRATFTMQPNCPKNNYFSRQLTPKAKKEIKTFLAKKKVTTFSEANRRSRKQLFRINCPIAFGISKQSWGETSFLGRHQIIRCGSKARKSKKKTKYDIIVSFPSLQSFWEKLATPEKSQTYLVCIRINCSVVSTSVFFDETRSHNLFMMMKK